MVQDERGNFLDYDELEEKHRFMSKRSGRAFWKPDAETMAISHGGHLVEMVPVKPKVPVSQEEAELIDDAVDSPGAGLASAIADYVDTHFSYISGDDCMDEEFRLTEAAIDGYTVVEPTKYNVKVPHTASQYYAKYSDTDELSTLEADSWFLIREYAQFTEDEIEHYGLEDCERVKIDTEDSDDN
jgi:hypothetical protein